MSEQNAGKTPEQLKQERQERVRRNLRILAIFVAGYYFVSAGFSWYEDHQAEQQQSQAAASSGPLASAADFRERFSAAVNAMHTSLPTANADDTPDGFIARLSPQLELRGIAHKDSSNLAYVQIQTRYTGALPPDSLNGFQAFVLACEMSSDLNLANEVLSKLDIIPAPDQNPDDKKFTPGKVQSGLMTYETTFTAGPVDELTLIATPLGQ